MPLGNTCSLPLDFELDSEAAATEPDLAAAVDPPLADEVGAIVLLLVVGGAVFPTSPTP